MNRVLFILIFSLTTFISCRQSPENETKIINKNDSINFNADENKLLNNIKLFPDSLLLKENLIQYYRDISNDSSALKATNDFIENDSLNSRLWHIKAILFIENDDTSNAINCFEKAIDILPSSSDIVYLGIIYAYKKNIKAITLSNNLIELFKDEYLKESFFIKGLYYSNTNNKTEAISFFDRSISESYTFMEAYREKAMALYDLKKFNEAIVVLTKATTIKNKYDEGYYYLGKCYEKINNPTMAADSYRRALLYNHENEEAAEALSVVIRVDSGNNSKVNSE